jgi:protein-tyrosine phosphatase
MSQYPGDKNEKIALEKLENYLNAGINTFINLQEKKELKRFVPYTNLLFKLNPNIFYYNFEIPDYNISIDELVDEFTNKICKMVLDEDKKILLHCWGGHGKNFITLLGRTGTISAIVLGKIYNLNYKDALIYVQSFHDCRDITNNTLSPQIDIQYDQVKRILEKFNNNQFKISKY